MWLGTEAEYSTAMLDLAVEEERPKPKMPPSKIAISQRRAALPRYILKAAPILSRYSIQQATGYSQGAVSSTISRLVSKGYLKRTNGVQPATYDITDKGREKLAGVVHQKQGRPRGAYGRA